MADISEDDLRFSVSLDANAKLLDAAIAAAGTKMDQLAGKTYGLGALAANLIPRGLPTLAGAVAGAKEGPGALGAVGGGLGGLVGGPAGSAVGIFAAKAVDGIASGIGKALAVPAKLATAGLDTLGHALR